VKGTLTGAVLQPLKERVGWNVPGRPRNYGLLVWPFMTGTSSSPSAVETRVRSPNGSVRTDIEAR
jgi:hypothetical protein